MTRYLVCSLILAGFIWVLSYYLNLSFKEWGFWSGMTICLVLTAVLISLGFAWDRYEHSRSQGSQR